MSDERPHGSEYLGVRLGEQHKLVLVPLDPDRPWAAFRRVRAWMRRTRSASEGSAGAEVIPFPRRDDASR